MVQEPEFEHYMKLQNNFYIDREENFMVEDLMEGGLQPIPDT